VEAGKLTALWVGGKGEASLTVTLEWSGSAGSEGTSSEDLSEAGSDSTGATGATGESDG
jgi:hypothetical protein